MTICIGNSRWKMYYLYISIKHKQDIQNKRIDDIKKWAIQVNLAGKDEYLIIPI